MDTSENKASFIDITSSVKDKKNTQFMLIKNGTLIKILPNWEGKRLYQQIMNG